MLNHAKHVFLMAKSPTVPFQTQHLVITNIFDTICGCHQIGANGTPGCDIVLNVQMPRLGQIGILDLGIAILNST